MIRNAKILGLAVVAVLAMTAVMASTAGAAQFTASSYPVTLKGSQTESHKFSVGGGTVTCTEATFTGTGTAASNTQTVNATYHNCTAFGFINSTVTGFAPTGGCDYLFYAGGTTDLDCTSGDVKIDASLCSVTLESGKNQNLGSNTYTNDTPIVGDVTVDSNVTGIHAVVTSSFGCPIAGGTYTTASYTGKTRMEGTNSKGENVNIDVR
jgi:hypothetical protein